MRGAMLVLWPSFLMAGGAVGLFFSMVDPADLIVFGRPLEAGRLAVYTMGFLAFWGFGAASSAITWLLGQGLDGPGQAPTDRK